MENRFSDLMNIVNEKDAERKQQDALDAEYQRLCKEYTIEKVSQSFFEGFAGFLGLGDKIGKQITMSAPKAVDPLSEDGSDGISYVSSITLLIKDRKFTEEIYFRHIPEYVPSTSIWAVRLPHGSGPIVYYGIEPESRLGEKMIQRYADDPDEILEEGKVKANCLAVINRNYTEPSSTGLFGSVAFAFRTTDREKYEYSDSLYRATDWFGFFEELLNLFKAKIAASE